MSPLPFPSATVFTIHLCFHTFRSPNVLSCNCIFRFSFGQHKFLPQFSYHFPLLSILFLCALLRGKGDEEKEILRNIKRRAEIILLLLPSLQLTGARLFPSILLFRWDKVVRSSSLPPPPSSSFFLVLPPRAKFQGCLTFQVITRTGDEVLLGSSSLVPLSSLAVAAFSY